MKIFSYLMLALLSTSALADGLKHQVIYNGSPVAAGGQSWRSTVGLSYDTADGRGGGCTGVFITRDVVLTAAHCKIKNKGNVTISLYKGNSTTPTYIFLGEDDYTYSSHPRYRETGSYGYATDDVAVLVLKTARLPDEFEPAELQTSAYANASDIGQPALIVGTGMRENGRMSDRLYFAQGTIGQYINGGVMVVDFTGPSFFNFGSTGVPDSWRSGSPAPSDFFQFNGAAPRRPGNFFSQAPARPARPPRTQGVCGGDSGGPVFVKAGNRLLLSALTTSTAMNLSQYCGSSANTNEINADRYRWIDAESNRIREAFGSEI